MFDKSLIVRHLRVAGILISANNVKGSFSYMDFGLRIRDKMYSQAILLLKRMKFNEIHLSDIVKKTEVLKLDQINEMSNNYFSIEDSENFMAAGHEVPFYLFIKGLIKNDVLSEFPSGFFNFGSVFRYSRNTKFPFNLGERRSFLEGYFVYLDSMDEVACFDLATLWNRRFLNDVLHLPSLETERPLITNKKFSKKTVCIDSITPLGRTVNTGMTYLHDDIFSKVFGVKFKINQQKKVHIKCVHFGVTDNTYFSYLLNSHDGRGFRLLTSLAPYCVQIILDSRTFEDDLEVRKLLDFLKENNASYEIYKGSKEGTTEVERSTLIRGIPMLIAVSKDEGVVNLTLNYRGDFNAQTITIENLHIILELLIRNDTDIIESFKKSQGESIVHCASVSEINSIVSNGKVAEVYLEHSDESVLSLESQISSGEILGFKESQLEGRDVLSQKSINQLAYVSRRI